MAEKLIKLIAFEDVGIKSTNRIKINFSKPQNFKREGVRQFTHVYAPSYPEIEHAYEKAGKQVFRPNEAEKPKKPEVVREEIVVEDVSEPETAEELPDSEWREMSWPKLRSTAKAYTDEPIKSKEQAEEVMLQAENDGKL